jgi:hypothetical protein
MKLNDTKVIVLIILIGLSACNKSNKPTPVKTKGSDTTVTTKPDTTTHVYIGGMEQNTPGGYYQPIYWKDGVIHNLAGGLKNSYIFTAAVNDTDFYIGGSITGSDNDSKAAYWKNGVLTTLPTATNNASSANQIIINKGDVYAVGAVQYFVGNNVATYWKNGTAISMNDQSQWSEASSIAVSGNDVYVGGDYYKDATKSNTIACYWKNGVLNSFDTPDSVVAVVSGIAISGSDVYECGYVHSSTKYTIASYWKNGVRTDVSDGTTNINITCIAALGSDVYMGGNIIAANGNQIACYWKNGAVVKLTTDDIIGWVSSICIHGTDIYFSGNIKDSGQNIYAVYWKNGNMVKLPTTSAIVNIQGIAVTGGH